MILRILAIAVTLFSWPAHGLVEVRGSVGFGIVQSTHFNDVLKNNSIPEVFGIGIYGIDGLVHIPGTGLVAGLRYDWQGIKVGDDDSNNAAIGCTRMAALLGYRLLDTGAFHVGPIFSYGIQHTPKVTLKTGNVHAEYDEGEAQSFSAGAEAGAVLGIFLVGLEGGFQSYLVKDVRKGSNKSGFDLNLGALYARGLIGFSF